MTQLRVLVLSLLCLWVLPWGAFARHFEAPGSVAASSPTVERLQRPCRVAALPDAGCAPEALPARIETAGTPWRGAFEIRNAARLRDLYRPQVPLIPPKRVG